MKSTPSRPSNALVSKPTSYSRVRSGPSSGLPSWLGVTAGCPSSAAIGSHVLTASNAPGAFPDSPTAARSFSVSHVSTGQKSWSERTYDALSLGYGWRPKSSPNALLPSTRSPAVTNSRSFQPTFSSKKKPALISRKRVSPVTERRAPEMSVGSPGPAKSSESIVVYRFRSSTSWPPHESCEVRLEPKSVENEPT